MDERMSGSGVFDIENLDEFLEEFEKEETVECENCTSTEALFKSLNNKGKIDFDYMAQVSGLDFATLISELRGTVYQDPQIWGEDEKSGWVLSNDYLSGNLIMKLEAAKEANEKYNNRFEENVKALKKLLRPEIESSKIYVSLGSTWVPSTIYDDFIMHLIGKDCNNGKNSSAYYKFEGAEYAVQYNNKTSSWYIPFKNRFMRYRNVTPYVIDIYGTTSMHMLYLLENTMNLKNVRSTYTDFYPDGTSKTVIDKGETLKRLERQNRIIEEFNTWIWADETRKNQIINAYMNHFGNIRCKVYDGSFLSFPGMNPEVKLYPYQKNAVARILFAKNTLLAHDVGTGKTYEIIAACMQLRRLKQSQKNMVVVPNAILGQWRAVWQYLYPEAKLLVVDSKIFNVHSKVEVLNKIKDEDYDAILITASCFDKMKVSNDYLYKKYEAEYEELKKMDPTEQFLTSRHRQLIRNLENKLKKIRESEKDSAPGFETLGINTLFIDESHNYKNLEIDSSIDDVAGFSRNGSEKCKNLFEKIRAVQEYNNGGRIVFATGTPVTNSIAEVYTIQRYLQKDELDMLGLSSFDAWSRLFISKTTELEIDVDTASFKTKTRFSEFKNLPELADILSGIADFHSIENKEKLPEFDGYTDVICESGKSFADYLKSISERVEVIRHHKISNKDDNMLKITTDGRKAALDLRLVGIDSTKDCETKVDKCAEQVMKIWRETEGTQLVFCDSSTPGKDFNMYDELKRVLVEKGMPKEKIVFIHDAESTSVKERIFSKMRNGEIAVMIGSTSKMGIGVNVQDRMIAIHHLDLPWRPSDMVQREGRLIRPGNQNDKVNIFRYITKASFDAYSWQLLEHKQRFIAQLLSGCVSERNTTDIDSSVLSYAEVKALAIGNPKIKKRCEVANMLDRYKLLQKQYNEDLQAMMREKQILPERIEDYKKRAKKVDEDLKSLAALDRRTYDYDTAQKKELNNAVYEGTLKYNNMPEDVKVGEFAGFDIIVPAHMVPRILGKSENGENKAAVPYICLRGNANYNIDIESENGIYTKLSNFCFDRTVKKSDKETGREELESYEAGIKVSAERLNEAIRNAKDRIAYINSVTKSPSHEYLDKIQELTDELELIDNELIEEAEKKAV